MKTQFGHHSQRNDDTFVSTESYAINYKQHQIVILINVNIEFDF